MAWLGSNVGGEGEGEGLPALVFKQIGFIIDPFLNICEKNLHNQKKDLLQKSKTNTIGC